jgi:methylmalonyl-CoA/ethylmalonyl-CoA epimerase
LSAIRFSLRFSFVPRGSQQGDPLSYVFGPHMQFSNRSKALELPVDHIAIAVPSIELARPIFERMTGGPASGRERVESQGVDVVFIGTGAARIELLEPHTAESAVGRFLAKRGQGLHHIAYRVDDLAATLASLAAAGTELIDRTPREGAHGRLVAFIHPRSAAGVLVELVQDR